MQTSDPFIKLFFPLVPPADRIIDRYMYIDRTKVQNWA